MSCLCLSSSTSHLTSSLSTFSLCLSMSSLVFVLKAFSSPKSLSFAYKETALLYCTYMYMNRDTCTVSLFLYQHICMFAYIYISVCLPISMYLHVCMFAYLCTNMSVCLPIYVRTCLYACLSMYLHVLHMFTYVVVCYLCLFVCLHVTSYLHVRMFVCLSSLTLLILSSSAWSLISLILSATTSFFSLSRSRSSSSRSCRR